MKNCFLRSLLLLLAIGSLDLHAESVLPAPGCDSIFWWLAGGISSARIQRLAQSNDATEKVSFHASPQCTHILQKAGADAGLIESLMHRGASASSKQSSNQSSKQSSNQLSNKSGSGTSAGKPAVDPSCAASSAAAQVAILVHNKNFDAAEDKLRTLLRADVAAESSNTALLHFVLGTVLRRQERFDEALDEFTQSSRLAPGFPETHSQLSYLFYRTEDSDDALAEARTALSIDPSNAEAYRYLGLALYADGHYDAALHAFDESLLREPASSAANADVYFDMGITHDQGKLDEAIVEYRAAKRLKPDEASVRNNLGNTLCDKEDFDSAITEFKDLFHQNPEWDGGHNCLARAYMSKRDYPSAVRELRAAIASNPAGAAEHRVLGQALLLQGKDQEAVDVLRQAVSLNPESSLGHHYLGTALVNTQQLAAAAKEFREAIRLEPSAQNHYSLAACLMALNQYEDALGELEIASRMDPSQNLYRARMQEVVRLMTNTK